MNGVKQGKSVNMFSNVKMDIQQRIKAENKQMGLVNLWLTWLTRSWLATLVYRFGRYAGDIKFRPLMIFCKVLYYPIFFLTQGITGISIQAHCRIAPGMVIRGAGGIFILAESIGENFYVGSGVTVGNVRGSKNLPVIGNNVTIEPGAKILGDVNIGHNVIIRGNSLVLTDIPDNTMAIGNPARIKKQPEKSEK
ncbi:MAG: serine acetyltransferase [Paraglaciecola sp.]|jgi:serine acetyltransferase